MRKILFENRVARLVWSVAVCFLLFFVGGIPGLRFDEFQTLWMFLLMSTCAMQIIWDVLDFKFLEGKIFKIIKAVLFYAVCLLDLLFVVMSLSSGVLDGFDSMPFVMRTFVTGCLLASPVVCVVYSFVATQKEYVHGIEPFVPLIAFVSATVVGILSAAIGGISSGMSKASPVIFTVLAMAFVVVIALRRGVPFVAVVGKKDKSAAHNSSAEHNAPSTVAEHYEATPVASVADNRKYCGPETLQRAVEEKMRNDNLDRGCVVGGECVKINYDVIFKGGYVDNSVEVKFVFDVESDVESTSAVSPNEAKEDVVAALLKDFEQTTESLHADLQNIATEAVEELRENYKGLDEVKKVVVELNVRKPDLSHVNIA